MTEKKLRGTVQRILGGKIPDELWDRAKENRYVASVLDEEDDVAYLVAQLLKNEGIRVRIESDGFFRKQRRKKGSALATEALSVVLAAKARDEPHVKEFRRRVLGGRLLDAGEVGPWIKNIGVCT